jgi:hypothetical protein
MRLAFGTLHVQLRRRKAGGQGVEHGIGIGRLAQNFQQTAARVGAVVKAVPALLEEDVTTHLAAQRCVNLFHFGLDQ